MSEQDEQPVIPDRSADDADLGWGDDDHHTGRGGDQSNDERLQRERPPHW